MALQGDFTIQDIEIDIADDIISTLALVGSNLTTMATKIARPVPILNPLLSVPRLSSELVKAGRASSEFVGCHMGSADPPTPGALTLGGYNNNHILGNLMNFTAGYLARNVTDTDH
jgi:hypothetical protein